MIPELSDALAEWRRRSPYLTDDDWVFASPFTEASDPTGRTLH